MRNVVRGVYPTLKYFGALSVPLILVLLASVSTLSAQPRFEVPLRVSDGTPVGTDTIYFGILPTANFCILERDSLNGHSEFFLPPFPPSGVFDARFIWPRTGANLACFDQGSLTDFRPYTIATQKDSIRIKCQLGQGTTMIISWPAGLSTRFTQLTIRYFDGSVNVNTDMLTNTSVNVTDAGDPATVNIYSGGLIPTSVEQTSTDVPEKFGLSQNYPNPFNPSTTIRFEIERAAATDISVYNILGQKIATLTAALLAPGYYTATWGGKNSAGSDVSSGVYFVRMSALADNGASFSAIRKLLLTR